MGGFIQIPGTDNYFVFRDEPTENSDVVAVRELGGSRYGNSGRLIMVDMMSDGLRMFSRIPIFYEEEREAVVEFLLGCNVHVRELPPMEGGGSFQWTLVIDEPSEAMALALMRQFR